MNKFLKISQQTATILSDGSVTDLQTLEKYQTHIRSTELKRVNNIRCPVDLNFASLHDGPTTDMRAEGVAY